MAQDNTKDSWYEGTIKGLNKADAMTVIKNICRTDRTRIFLRGLQ